jgi:signal transduction histidine kinase
MEIKSQSLTLKEFYNQFSLIQHQLSFKSKVLLLLFRCATVVMAVACIIFIIPAGHFRLSPYLLCGIAFLDTLFIAFLPLIFHPLKSRLFSIISIAADIAVCIFLVTFSGAIGSPFNLFFLAPLLTSSLSFNRIITFIIAIVMGLAIILNQVLSPFYPFLVSPLSISQITTFVMAIALTASLPYLINGNLKQRLEDEQVRLERQRLSREIHDGVAQTLHALCWQVQQVRRHLDLNDKNDYDVEKLEKLAERARRDILQALEILRDRETESDLRSVLTDCLEDFKQDNNIDYSLNFDNAIVDLESESKKELASICREALANIKKHAGAHSVQVDVKQENGQIRLSIADDGRGFDAVSYYRNGLKNNGHHGLAVMKERADLINGKLHILSLPQRGTEVQVEVPCNFHKARMP